MSATRVAPFGDGALLIELEQRVDEAIVARSTAIADAWESFGHGTAIPGYASVVLAYDPERLTGSAAEEEAHRVLRDARTPSRSEAARLTVVPTRYDGDDLADVAVMSGLTIPQLIDLHASREYTAFFLGFMPGFAYLGTLDPRIRAPRLASPRPRVPEGAVAVADGQTAIYPFASPGGWRLIGRADLRLFDPAADPPSAVRAGDRVRFTPL